MTRRSSMSASFSTCSISFFTMRPTGMPVQSATTLAMALRIHARENQRDSPWNFFSFS